MAEFMEIRKNEYSKGTVNSLEIRESRKTDAAAMMEIENLVWTASTTPGEIHFASEAAFLLKNPPGTKKVAVIEGKAVGILGYHSPTSLTSHKHVWTFDIAVHPDYQKRGIGSALLAELKRLATAEHIHKLSLRVLSNNEKAILLYKRAGFEVEGILKQEFYLNGQFVDDVLMAYFL